MEHDLEALRAQAENEALLKALRTLPVSHRYTRGGLAKGDAPGHASAPTEQDQAKGKKK